MNITPDLDQDADYFSNISSQVILHSTEMSEQHIPNLHHQQIKRTSLKPIHKVRDTQPRLENTLLNIKQEFSNNQKRMTYKMFHQSIGQRTKSIQQLKLLTQFLTYDQDQSQNKNYTRFAKETRNKQLQIIKQDLQRKKQNFSYLDRINLTENHRTGVNYKVKEPVNIKKRLFANHRLLQQENKFNVSEDLQRNGIMYSYRNIFNPSRIQAQKIKQFKLMKVRSNLNQKKCDQKTQEKKSKRNYLPTNIQGYQLLKTKEMKDLNKKIRNLKLQYLLTPTSSPKQKECLKQQKPGIQKNSSCRKLGLAIRTNLI